MTLTAKVPPPSVVAKSLHTSNEIINAAGQCGFTIVIDFPQTEHVAGSTTTVGTVFFLQPGLTNVLRGKIPLVFFGVEGTVIQFTVNNFSELKHLKAFFSGKRTVKVSPHDIKKLEFPRDAGYFQAEYIALLTRGHLVLPGGPKVLVQSRLISAPFGADGKRNLNVTDEQGYAFRWARLVFLPRAVHSPVATFRSFRQTVKSAPHR